ncbi:MAG TPA: LysR substrate-binding domain-containing protein, partial [Candidatus Ozemobacteraceae bacterium]|nr:LysR substrate-binding domain-containing protein [Candidatus Ozemobacteraceae bacterium]
RELHPTRLITVNHLRGMVNLASAGVGVALVPAYCAAAEVRSGRLRILFPKSQILEDWFSLYGRQGQRQLPKVSAFVAFMKSWKPTEFEAANEGQPSGAVRKEAARRKPRENLSR